MDISAALNGPWDTPRSPKRIAEEVAVLASSQVPSTGNGNGNGNANTGLLPESTFYRWSCGHFSRPLLEPFHDDDDENLARRERREREALNGIATWEHSSEWLLGTLVTNL